MRKWVGFDVGKAFHWVCVLDEGGEEVLSRKVEATEEYLEAACSEIEWLGGERTVGIDLLGGPATLLGAVLLERNERIFHVPGIAVNGARDAYPGEAKSDSKDAHVIADQLRLRHGSLQEVCSRDEIIAEMRVLVAHRRDLLQDQTRRAARHPRDPAGGDESSHARCRPQTRKIASVQVAQGAGCAQGPRSRRADRRGRQGSASRPAGCGG